MRRSSHEVRTFEIRESVLTRALARNDDWGEIVSVRIQSVHDLVAAEARYHRDCYTKFWKDSSGRPDGRPKNSELHTAFENV